jgi:hypothetical protein
MSAALSCNEVADESMGLRGPGLAHGRRKFRDVEAVFPRESQVGREVIGQVGDHDAQARQEQRSPAARLADHQAHRRPLLDELQGWRDTQSDAHLVAPNSSLGTALTYMPRHWATVPRVLSVPGAPMDNTWAERLLKRCIRQRNNSLFDKTPHRAYLASVLSRRIATGIDAGGNAGDSLVALPEQRHEVFWNPEAGLPWGYASSRASPAAPRRQSFAIWARSGWPFQVQMMSARAARGTRASGLLGHHEQRPGESRWRIIQSP